MVAYAASPDHTVVLPAGRGRIHCRGSKLTFAKATPGSVDRRYTCQGGAAPSTTSTSTTTTTAPPVPAPPTPSTSPPSTPPSGGILFAHGFDLSDQLLTNEYAYWNPGARDAHVSPDWEMTSGSLFVRGNAAWSGVPDTVEPNATSSNGTDSAVFRLTTKRDDFGDVGVAFDLVNARLLSTADTPAVDWDGIHIFLRYQSEESLYYASVNRRDGTVVMKKKCAGGPDNGGTYYELTSYQSGHPIPFGARQRVGATVRNNPDGSVTLSLVRDGVTLQTATDRGVGCKPITTPGKVGIRGDNDEFSVDNFSVASL